MHNKSPGSYVRTLTRIVLPECGAGVDKIYSRVTPSLSVAAATGAAAGVELFARVSLFTFSRLLFRPLVLRLLPRGGEVRWRIISRSVLHFVLMTMLADFARMLAFRCRCWAFTLLTVHYIVIVGYL